MRSLSFIVLALGFVLAGSSMAGSADGNLPGVGTFAYDGPPIAGSSQTVDEVELWCFSCRSQYPHKEA